MMDFLSNAFSTSMLAATQLVLATFFSSNPWFENVELRMAGRGEVMCSARLVDSFSKSMDTMLMSGETITIRFQMELLHSETDEVVGERSVAHGFRYNPTEDRYYVLRSQDEELEDFPDFESAKEQLVSLQDVGLMDGDDLDRRARYILRLTSSLEPGTNTDLTENVNLTMLWAGVKPVYVSEPFSFALQG